MVFTLLLLSSNIAMAQSGWIETRHPQVSPSEIVQTIQAKCGRQTTEMIFVISENQRHVRSAMYDEKRFDKRQDVAKLNGLIGNRYIENVSYPSCHSDNDHSYSQWFIRVQQRDAAGRILPEPQTIVVNVSSEGVMIHSHSDE